jgi:mono/diheme cytochrome c family protein
MMKTLTFLGAVSLSLSARAVEPRLAGDVTNGAKLYKLHCAACHGPTGGGDGPLARPMHPSPGRARDAGVLLSRGDDGLVAKLTGQLEKGGWYHGRGLTELDARDIVAWIGQPVPALADFFPAAGAYVSREETIDADGLDRIEKALGDALDDDEAKLLLFTLLKPEAGQSAGELVKLGSDGAGLVQATPKRRIGWLAFLPVTVGGEKLDLGLSVDRNHKVKKVLVLATGDEKRDASRRKWQAAFDGYVGLGREALLGRKGPKDVQDAMSKAYLRLFEAAAMYQKDERDRFAFDPDAFKSDEPAPEVKFDLKSKRR